MGPTPTTSTNLQGPFRGEKGTTWEGGLRVPCLIHPSIPYVVNLVMDPNEKVLKKAIEGAMKKLESPGGSSN